MASIEPEAGLWYAACWIVVIVRFISKRMRLGSWRNLQIDDYLMIPAMMTLTTLMALLHIVINTNNNLIQPWLDVSKFSPEEIQERIYGSKLTIIVEQMQILTIWLLKACILIMYSRMTTRGLLTLHIAVKGVAIYVGLSFLVMEILWFGVWCRPFNQYWAVPTNSTQCSAMLNHLITNAVLNISSDLMIMAIPIPLVIKVKLPTSKKLVLIGIFLIGVVTIFAAAYNKYKSFKDPFSTEWVFWYMREAFTAMLCANLPLTRPVIAHVFNIRDWSTNRPSFGPSSRYGRRTGRSTYQLHGESTTQHSFAITSQGGRAELTKPMPAISRGRTESEEDMVRRPLEILYKTDIIIERHPVDPTERDESSIELESVDERRSTENSDAMSTKSGRPRSLITTCYHETEGSDAKPIHHSS